MIPGEINLPITAKIFEANHPEEVIEDEQLDQLLNKEEIRNLLSNPSIIIINDHHRSTPSGRILKSLARLYAEDAQVDFIVIASGTHEDPTDKQLSKLTHLTEEKFNCELLLHDAIEEEIELVELGTTSRGTRVKVHPVILDYDNILCINSVEPHYFAGFTGGIKSIVPGLAAKSTVEQNHSWALSPNSGPTKVDDNPLQQDLWEAGNLTGKTFYGIQLVNFQNEIFHISVGELREAFDEARDVSKQIYSREVTEKFDVIVSIVYPPLDHSLYQAQKGIENTRQALKKGGEMILVAKCEGGIGNEAFYTTMKEYDDIDEVLDSISQETYKFGDHKAYKFATLSKDSKITLFGDLTLTQSRNVFANSRSMQELEGYLSDLSLRNQKIAVVLDSGSLSLYHNS